MTRAERDRDIRHLYQSGLTMQECGDRYGLTKGRVQQIIKGRTSKVNQGRDTSPEGRFWEKVRTSDDPNECWEWTRALNTRGYGHFFLKGKHVTAHRFSFLLAKGREPLGWILHTCDNPRCVNPNHLYEGSPQDNADDRVVRGRARATGPKLRPKQVEEIRRLVGSVSQSNLAERYAVNVDTINSIATGRTHRKKFVHE